MSGGMEFPAGAMLTVQRRPESDAHGDPKFDAHGDPITPDADVASGEWPDSHQIGPCDIPTSTSRNAGVGDGRAVDTINVNAPADSDIRKTDRIRLPNGVVASITSDIERPRNPFTNWTPFIHFTLKAVI